MKIRPYIGLRAYGASKIARIAAAVWERTLPLCGLSPEFLQDAVGSQLAGEDGNRQA